MVDLFPCDRPFTFDLHAADSKVTATWAAVQASASALVALSNDKGDDS